MEREQALTILNDALQKVRNIPENEWINRVFTDGFGACCVIGHYTRLTSSNPSDYKFKNCYDDWGNIEQNRNLRVATRSVGIDIAGVNNGEELDFQQPTTKARAIAGLEAAITKLVCKEL